MQARQQPAASAPPPVHPALAGLPSPADASANAELSAQQTAQKLTAIGQMMHDRANAMIPTELRGLTPEEAGRVVRYNQFGEPITAARQESEEAPGNAIADGFAKTAEPGLRPKAGGVSQMIRGAGEIALPTVAPGLLVDPLPAAAGLVGGGLAGAGTEAGLKKLGVPEEYADLAGDAAGMIGGGLAAHGIGKLGPKPAIEPTNILPPEQAPMNQRLTGDVEETTPAAGKQPIHSSRTASPDFDEFMTQRQQTAQPAKPSAASQTTVDVTSEATNEPHTPKKEAVTNDNRTDIPVGRGVEPQPQTQEEGRGVEQPAIDGNAAAGTPAESGAGAETAAGQPEDRALEQIPPRPPQVAPVYGSETTVRVPGEKTSYPAKYAVREASDVQPSHNPFSFEANPDYHYQNDRDYSQAENASRVVGNGQPGTYDPAYTIEHSPTAEHGSPVIDPNGNALGGNSRTMTQMRVFEHNPAGADAYRARLAQKAEEFGLDPAELSRFKNPVLVRELQSQPTKVGAQNAITDFNKTAAAKLAPEEQAVSDGRRLSPRTIGKLSGNLADVGDDSTLAQALSGEKGDEILESLVTDGVLTRQEKAGLVDDRGQLTPAAKDRVAKALVGRLYDAPADYARSAPETRNKLEKIAPQVLRVEDRPEWALTQPVREAVNILADAKTHGVKNLSDLAKQTGLSGETKGYSAEGLAVATKLRQGEKAAVKAFRQYANDSELSREGAQAPFWEPPTRAEAFEAAFGEKQQEPLKHAVASVDETTIHVPDPKGVLAPGDYKFGADTGYHIARLGSASIALPGRHAANAVAVALNVHGMELIARMASKVRDIGATRLGGVHIATQDALRLRGNLDIILAQHQHPPKGVLLLRALADQAIRENKSLVLVKQTPVSHPHKVQIALREELNHARQHKLEPSKGVLQHLGDTREQFVASKLALQAKRSLEVGYRFRTTGETASEIGVRLMVPGRHGELGLSLPEARSLAAHYVRSLRKEYGHARPKEIIRDVFDALRRADRRGAKQSGGLPDGSGSGRRGGAPEGAGQDLRSTPNETHPARAHVPEQFSEPIGRTVGPDKQAGLFSDKEATEVTAGSASDSAKLQGERLTAQLKSPLTREEQLRKLKTPKSQQTDLFGENGGPLQGTLFNSGAADEPDELVPQRHYSNAGHWETLLVRNLSELRRAAPGAFLQSVNAASAQAQAQVMLHTAMPLIVKALGDSMPVEQFMRAGTESRLRGRADFYREQADLIGRMTDTQIEKNVPNILPLFQKIQDRRGLGRNLGHTVASLAEKKDFATLRAFAQDTFMQAANAVAHVMTPAEFNATRHTPTFQDALRIYKDRIEGPMRAAHVEHEGVLTQHVGPLDTYFPLIPVKPEKIGTTAPARQAYSRPGNRFNNFATGLADDYSTDMEEFSKRLVSGIRASGRAGLVDALKEEGLMQPLENGVGPNGEYLIYRGVPYHAVKRTVADAKTIIHDGKITHRPPEEMLLPRWLAGETDPILDKSKDYALPDPTLKEIFDNLRSGRVPTFHDAVAIMAGINDAAVSGVGEPVYHGTNLIGTVIANTPFLGESPGARAASLPLAKLGGTISGILHTHTTSEQDAAELMEMAKLGMLTSKFGNTTVSKKYAETTGSTLNRHSLAASLWGPSGADARSRLFMYRIAKQIWKAEERSPDDYVGMHKFVNQLGIYSQPMASALVRSMKESPFWRMFAPFVTAGTTMGVNAVNTIAGTAPIPAGRPGLRLALLINSAVGVAVIAAYAHKQLNGSWPWEDKAGRLGEVAVRREHLTSQVAKKLYRQLYGNEPVGYLKMNWFNPLAMRGLRETGIKGAADTAMAGGRWWQDFEEGAKGVLNAAMQPFIGPVPRTALVGLTGHEPSFMDLYGKDGQFHPELYQPKAERNKGGNKWARRAAATAEEMNSSLGGMVGDSGQGLFPELFGKPKNDEENEWVRMAFDLGTPGLVGSAANPTKKAAFLRRQAAAEKRRR
jgi:hypothetical protein